MISTRKRDARVSARLRAAAITALLLLTGPSVWAPAHADPKLPGPLGDVGIDQNLGGQIPLDLEFTDELGRKVRLGDYFDKKPVILTLVYYECPMLCTLVLNGLVSSLGVLSLEPGKDYELVTVSFDPGESPELASAKKKTYVDRLGRDGAIQHWHFLTGKQEAIKKLTAAVGFRYTYDPKTDLFAHASAIMIATPKGQLSSYMYGVEFAPRDLRLNLVKASQGGIGTLADAVLLFCYHYDPVTGKYSAAAFNVIRLGGIITVLAIGGFIFLALRRERPKHHEDARSHT
ncbi:MAG TPA: SCO family protein [Candidatus Saccharimonadales bacterium]|nr:SCO family protein [Candidatus Saccharimonadales bacterium]